MGMMMGKSCMLVASMLLLMIHSSVGLTRCKKHEQETLLKFKHSFTRDSQRVLSSWIGDDCCHWHGVSCDSGTGNVIKLNLTNSLTSSDFPTTLVSSELSSSLLELKFLTHLDLSWNNFTSSRIPEFIGSMTQLRYLTLSYAGFSGPIPPQLGNLTNLIHLDLNDAGQYMLYTQERLEWASGLSKLQFLVMDGINMSQAHNSLQVLFRLPSLLSLSLWGCSLHNTHLAELLITNTSTLQYLDLSHNNFEGPFPSFLKNMPSLQSLSLWTNNFNGSVPPWLCNMRRLEYLDFYQNKFSGSLPSQFGQLTNLNYIDLSYNGFQGQLPTSLAKLTALKHLDLINNGFSGLIPDLLGPLTELEYLDISSNSIQGTVSHIGNLSKLSILNMNFNNLKLNLSTAWQPPFQLQVLGASSCEINTAFPQWLRNQTQIERLDLSYTGITGEMPQWVWNFTNLNDLQVAGNNLTGSLPRHITCDGCNLEWLDLHNNMLSGTIPYWLKHQKTMAAVDLSQNLLSERIFEGENASSLFSGNSLELLDLSDNIFFGEIQVKNISSNAYLIILSLQGNDFSGPISSQFCHFTHLAILELAHNRLSGNIPRCLGSQIFESYVRYDSSADTEYQEIIKGTTENIGATMGAQSIIDLSCNLLVGTIPEELTNISKLMQLNLSNNHLTGVIPHDIGKLKLLESLDLSNNNLSGTIPQSLSDIQWLSVLNLSYNHLHGPIPTGSQLQTLTDPSIYAGNSGLYGFLLPKSSPPPTPTDDDHGAEDDDDGGDKYDMLWLYLAIMSGFATGFWGVFGTLVFKNSWRHAYFWFIEKTADRIYVLFKLRLKRRSSSTETENYG